MYRLGYSKVMLKIGYGQTTSDTRLTSVEALKSGVIINIKQLNETARYLQVQSD